MDDFISRADVIEEIEITSFEDYGDYITVRKLIETFPSTQYTSKIIDAYTRGWTDGVDAIKAMPLAQPKRGEWVETEYDGRIYNMYRCAYKCSECGYKPMYRGEPIVPTSYTLLYCPNCGARMTDSEKPNNSKVSEIPTGSERSSE